MQLNISDIVAWETLIYAGYIARNNPLLFDDRMVRRHGSRGLPPALFEGSYFMAKARKNNDRANNFKPVKWVNTALTDEDCDFIAAWDVSDVELLGALIMLVDTGHSLTCKPVPSEDSFMAAACGVTDDCANDGLGLSAYALSTRDAFKALVYKHFNIHDRTWPEPSDRAKRTFR